jgi:hypothetical protein
MNVADEIQEMVDNAELTTDGFRAPAREARWIVHVRLVLDGWMYPVAVVAEFGTHWGDRIVVCEIVPLDCRSATDIDKLVRSARRRLAVEIGFYLNDLNCNPAQRRGPFEVLVGQGGQGI